MSLADCYGGPRNGKKGHGLHALCSCISVLFKRHIEIRAMRELADTQKIVLPNITSYM